MAITGECFCGGIQYRVSGSLRDARSCHCSRCRKAFSSQASAYALVEPGEFEWLQGEALLTSYVRSRGSGCSFVVAVARRYAVPIRERFMVSR
jgi:hypothetical protein